MRPRRVIFSLILLFGLGLGFYHFILDWNGQPTCHKGIMFAFLNAMHQSGGNIANNPRPFPNVKGLSQDSLATIDDGTLNWTYNYNYVPGLREDDPPDLLLMYFNRPTRWNWHGSRPTIFKKKAWIVIPVNFDPEPSFRRRGGQIGECSVRLSPSEFRVQLKRTLDFIRTNERPNWEAVVAEHLKFLDSIEPVNR